MEFNWGYWDYSLYNYCLTCKLQYHKGVLRCTECGKLTRKYSQHKMGQKEHTRL